MIQSTCELEIIFGTTIFVEYYWNFSFYCHLYSVSESHTTFYPVINWDSFPG